ncbi:hypothetical protein [Pontiella sp.]|uniref:hypothetical protein n=1 Tax=Pontiella sp. TaxID=2837462 RepID=UPI0035624CCE
MSFQNLSKEQKQYVFLGVLAVAGLLYGTFIGIRGSLASVRNAKDELDALTAKIERADATLSRARNTGAEFTQSAAVLKGLFGELPPEQNYYSWATEIIFTSGRAAGLEIDAVDEVRRPKSKGDALKEGVKFESYALKIAAKGNLEDTKIFMRTFEQEHPMVRFYGLEISSGTDPEKHTVQLFVEWPARVGEVVAVWEAVGQKQMELTGRKTEIKAIAAALAGVAEASTAVAESVPEPVAVEPKIEQPAPVAVAVPEKPAPKPVVVVEPVFVEPVIEEPAPVAEPVPEPEPVFVEPVIEEPTPVAVAEPVPEPEPVFVEPVIEEPTPVAVAEPVPEPAPVLVEPVIEEPAPVAEPVPEPESEELDSILASIDSIETAQLETDGREPKPEESELQTLLAMLGSHGDREPEPEAETASTDPAALAALVMELETTSKRQDPPAQLDPPALQETPILQDPPALLDPPKEMVKPEPLPVVVPEPTVAQSGPRFDPEGEKYVSTPSSSQKLADLLRKDESKNEKTLGSFLDGILEGISESE